jgi:hypothetical protein
MPATNQPNEAMAENLESQLLNKGDLFRKESSHEDKAIINFSIKLNNTLD